ncbi:MAG: methyltransferase [Alphaproteobacteria bacterium]|nr:methyltransferase [Alphaproteobacteria bacterium]
MADPVQEHYEALPYPPRDPRDEAKRLITGSPSRLDELNHYVYGGARDFGKPFRALVAGGGTGDAAIMLAQQLADAGANAEVVYLDWSKTTRAVAEARAAARRLTNIRFVSGSLIEFGSLGLGRFDYIDCCGVLHHLPDPAAGLASLAGALNDEGGLGLMLYARLGRTGIYPLQEALRGLLNDADNIDTRLAVAKKLLAQLPATNWLKRNPFVTDHLTEGDSGIFDLLLHARDRAYDVAETNDFVEAAALRLVAFVPEARYRPESYVSDAALLKRIERLSPIERAALAENIVGNLKSHVFYAVKRANPVTPPAPDRPDLVPVYCELDPAELGAKLKPAGVLTASFEGWQSKLPLPPLAPAIAGLIDGKRNLGQVHAALRERRADLAWDEFAAQFRVFYAAFNGIARLMLRAPSR